MRPSTVEHSEDMESYKTNGAETTHQQFGRDQAMHRASRRNTHQKTRSQIGHEIPNDAQISQDVQSTDSKYTVRLR